MDKLNLASSATPSGSIMNPNLPETSNKKRPSLSINNSRIIVINCNNETALLHLFKQLFKFPLKLRVYSFKKVANVLQKIK